MVANQCDQIWRFIGLWTTFKSFWQYLICPNLSHSYGIFVKESKSIIFLVKSFLGKFYRHLAIFFWSRCRQCSRTLCQNGQNLLHQCCCRQTVAFLEVSTEEALRLKSMPDIVTHFRFGLLDGTYVLPPIKYPDGKIYLKVGLNHLIVDCHLVTKKLFCSKLCPIYFSSRQIFCRIKGSEKGLFR